MSELYPLLQINKDCKKCPELVRSRKRITFGYGSPKSRIIFLGEAPGYNGCDVTGIPFTRDPSGELFQQMLHEVGWDKESVYVSNVVKCCPPGNRTPTPEEIENCRVYLEYEFTKVDPILVVLMGKPALQFFFPLKTKIVNNWDKAFSHLDYPNALFISIPHSAYIVRNRDLIPKYVNSFARLKNLTKQWEECHAST